MRITAPIKYNAPNPKQNQEKFIFFAIFNNKCMLTNPKINATNNPTIDSKPINISPLDEKNNCAAITAGIDNKKLILNAFSGSILLIINAVVVIPEREIPGRIENPCASPVIIEFLIVSFPPPRVLFFA